MVPPLYDVMFKRLYFVHFIIIQTYKNTFWEDHKEEGKPEVIKIKGFFLKKKKVKKGKKEREK